MQIEHGRSQYQAATAHDAVDQARGEAGESGKQPKGYVDFHAFIQVDGMAVYAIVE